jgi:hypothetical protein
MAYPTTPGQSLNAVAVTSTASTGVGTTQAVGATVGTAGTHAAVFTVTLFNQGANSEAELVLVIEGNLDGSTWVNLGSMTVEANGVYLLVPSTG